MWLYVIKVNGVRVEQKGADMSDQEQAAIQAVGLLYELLCRRMKSFVPQLC